LFLLVDEGCYSYSYVRKGLLFLREKGLPTAPPPSFIEGGGWWKPILSPGYGQEVGEGEGEGEGEGRGGVEGAISGSCYTMAGRMVSVSPLFTPSFILSPSATWKRPPGEATDEEAANRDPHEEAATGRPP
jgi:hypothetical protein